MSDYTFPEIEDYFGSSQMDIIKKRGTKAAITDYAILCGGYVSSSEHVDNNSSLEGRTGWYWTKTDDGDNDARAVSVSGNKN